MPRHDGLGRGKLPAYNIPRGCLGLSRDQVARVKWRAHMKGRHEMWGRRAATVCLFGVLLMTLSGIAQGQGLEGEGLTVTSVTTPQSMPAGLGALAGLAAQFGADIPTEFRETIYLSADGTMKRGRSNGWGHHLQPPGRLPDRDRQQQPNVGEEVFRGG